MTKSAVDQIREVLAAPDGNSEAMWQRIKAFEPKNIAELLAERDTAVREVKRLATAINVVVRESHEASVGIVALHIIVGEALHRSQARGADHG